MKANVGDSVVVSVKGVHIKGTLLEITPCGLAVVDTIIPSLQGTAVHTTVKVWPMNLRHNSVPRGCWPSGLASA